MRNLYGVISCCVLLSLAVVLDNAHAKKPQKSAEVSAISLDVLRVKACAVGQGCSTVGGPKQWNLFDLAEGKTDFANQVLMPAKTHELRLMLGSKSTITVDGQTYPLTVPSGQVSGLKLKGNKVFASASGFLKSIRLNFDLAKGLVVQVKGKGKKDKETLVYSYSLKPVIQVSSAEVTPMPENMTAVVALPEREILLTRGDNFSLLIPVGAVSVPVVISAQEIASAVYELKPEGQEFVKPILLTIGYNPDDFSDFSESDIHILRNGTRITSKNDSSLKKLMTSILEFSIYTVGIAPPLPIYISPTDQSSSISDTSGAMSEDELEKKLEGIEENLKENFINMYYELDHNASNGLNSGHDIFGFRSKEDAHRFSTGSNIYRGIISLNVLKGWAKSDGKKDDNGNVSDDNSNIWYKYKWETSSELKCSLLCYSFEPYCNSAEFQECINSVILDYARDNAKNKVPEITNTTWDPRKEDTVNVAEEGYSKDDPKRKPNHENDTKISRHVSGKAVDLKIKWDLLFDGGGWGNVVNKIVNDNKLYRPISSEPWHFELASVEVKPPDDKSCPYGNGLYCGDGQLDRDKNTLYYCDNGNYDVRERCTNGCQVMDPGENDKCKSEQTTCPYGTGYYCGDDQLGQDKDTLYYCKDGRYDVHEQCSNGCEEKPPYVNDVCK